VSDLPKGAVESKLPSNIEFKVIDCMAKAAIDAPLDSDYVALNYVWGSATDTHERSLGT
jgi:hypothetical protein